MTGSGFGPPKFCAHHDGPAVFDKFSKLHSRPQRQRLPRPGVLWAILRHLDARNVLVQSGEILDGREEL